MDLTTIDQKAFEEYHDRVLEAWKALTRAMQDPPPHTYIRFDLLRMHGRELKHEFDLSIKYPLIGPSGNFRESEKLEEFNSPEK